MSEGRDRSAIAAVAGAGGGAVLDVHSDADHHRSVVTLAGDLDTLEAAARAVVTAAVSRIDIGSHDGVHPRFGAADVVPVVPLAAGEVAWASAVGARDRMARWIGEELAVPCFLYGTDRTLPEVRRAAFRGLSPDTGPPSPHPTAGATAVGVRRPLVAYNLWLEADAGAAGEADVVAAARGLATELRSPGVRALGLPVARGSQVSCNLVEPTGSLLVAVHDTVAAGAPVRGCRLVRAELVGLVPSSTLEGIPRSRWTELDVDEDRTIEFRWTAGARISGPEGDRSAVPPSDDRRDG